MGPDDPRHRIKSDRATLSGHDMVYFGPTKWDGLWRNRHQLMSRFARSNKVMYVEPIVTLRKIISRKKTYWSSIKTAIFNGTVRSIQKNLYIYDSPFFPIIGRKPFKEMTRKLWREKFKSTLKKHNFKRPIVWFSSPTMIHLIDQFDEKISIYHVVDEYSEYRGADKAYMLELEKRFLEKVDLVVVVSEKLFKAKKKYHSNVHMIQNGVDYDAYETVINAKKKIPDDIRNLRRPILGYSGLISYRLDLNLIKQTAQNFPNSSIALLGTIDSRGCEEQIAKLNELPNVHFLGIKPIDQVPEYIVSFDASLIPYAKNGEVENLSPLKLYDSMAAGIPVIATDFPAAQEFKELIYIANTEEQFIRSINLAIKESDMEIVKARRHAASMNTWEDRIAQITGILSPLVSDIRQVR